MRHPFFDVPVPSVLGHRGAGGEAPENTLPSFRRALELGAHILESDLHCSADGVPVLAHDPEVDRVTGGTGAISRLRLVELQRLDAGARFTTDCGSSFPFRGQGVVIPTLESVFDMFPAARFNLEVKAAAAVVATIDLIEKFERADRTLLAAADDETMASVRARLRERGVHAAVGASTGEVLAFIRAAQAGSPPDPGVMALQIPTEFGGQPLITPELIARAHAHEIAVHAWTINEESEMQRLLDLGVDGLVTDYPGRMVELLARRGAG